LATVKVSSPPHLLFVVFRCVRVVLLLLPLAPLHAQTQASMNAEARSDFQRADADLNKTYQLVLAKLPTVESKQKLREAQRAWVVSRDAEAAHAAN
jgi:Lysozyme inhibitor LprI